MTITSKTTIDYVNTASTRAYGRRILNAASKVGRFILHLLEMTLAMMAGMVVLYSLEDLISPSSSFVAAFESETIMFDFAMAVFMTVPMVGWMIARRHGLRHSAEMAFGMNVPVAAIIVLRLLGGDAYLPWLADASHPAMFLGMIVAMLARSSHYTGKAGHAAHAAHG